MWGLNPFHSEYLLYIVSPFVYKCEDSFNLLCNAAEHLHLHVTREEKTYKNHSYSSKNGRFSQNKTGENVNTYSTTERCCVMVHYSNKTVPRFSSTSHLMLSLARFYILEHTVVLTLLYFTCTNTHPYSTSLMSTL